MELVNIEKLVDEISSVKDKLVSIRSKIDSGVDSESEFMKLVREEFECSMILSGAYDDLTDIADILRASGENPFLLNRVIKEIEKCKPLRLEL